MWFYCKPAREHEVFSTIRLERIFRGFFTGYFHYVSKPGMHGVFDPGTLQFETTSVLGLQQVGGSLAVAMATDDVDTVRRLLGSQAIDGRDLSVILWHYAGGHQPDLVVELLKKGADANVATEGGDTALMMATWNRDFDTVKILLEHGVSVKATNFNGETPLMLATYNGSDGKIVQLFLDAGADPNAKGNSGATTLIYAASTGDAAAAEKLLKAGADPLAKDKYGSTAESEACDRGEKGHYQVCLLVRDALRKK